MIEITLLLVVGLVIVNSKMWSKGEWEKKSYLWFKQDGNGDA
tara:strand:+ start:431 stop:556 length:126 start_codon:yes stop_codon:yes gene_type:complete